MTEELIERWKRVKDFEDYVVSNYGKLMNAVTDILKTPSANQNGAVSYLLVKDGMQYRRTGSRLVAEAFLPPPPKESFDSIINLDDDRFNNHVHNLAWRPRWFAVQYHMQFKEYANSRARLVEVETEREFRLREAAMEFGLLEKELLVSAHNHSPVFPTWQVFHLVLT